MTCSTALDLYLIIGSAAGGGGGLLLLIIIIIIVVVYYRRKRPVPPKRGDTSSVVDVASGQESFYAELSETRQGYEPLPETNHYESRTTNIERSAGADGQSPIYLDLSKSKRECELFSEKNPYKSKIVHDERLSGSVHDGYLTASTTVSFREGPNDLRMSHPEEDDSGYLRSSNDHRNISSGSIDLAVRYQPWDMMQHQARRNFNLPATNPLQNRYDERTSRFQTQYRY